MLLIVATHRAANKRATSLDQDQDQGRLHQLYTYLRLIGGLDLARSRDPGEAEVRAPLLSHDLSRGVEVQAQGNEDEARILLQFFLLPLRIHWSFICHRRARGVKAQEGTCTTIVHVNRGVDPVQETVIVVGFSSHMRVVEAETAHRLLLSPDPLQQSQHRLRHLRLRSLYLPWLLQAQWS